MEIYIVLTSDDGGHYGATKIDKVFLDKKRAENYIFETNSKASRKYLEYLMKTNKEKGIVKSTYDAKWVEQVWMETHNAT